jgi:hypothetical protein
MSRSRAHFCAPFVICLAATVSSCISTASSGRPRPVTVSIVPAPVLAAGTPADAAGTASLVAIDSVSIRPREISPGSEIAFITIHQGGRYHPETVRALANDSVVLSGFAAQLVNDHALDRSVILDFQGSNPDDVRELATVVRAIGQVTRAHGQRSLSLVVPAQDTVAYPTLVLARLADMLIVRLEGEHRPGTPAGPPVSPDFVTRAVGLRASLIGASRIGVEIPLFGYLWDKTGAARPITFSEAQALVLRETGVFTRDPPSHYLTASGRDGWTAWVPDARTVRFIVETARRRGVTRFFLAGPVGADADALRAAN